MVMKNILWLSISLGLVLSCTKRIEIEPTPGEEVAVIQAFLFNDSVAKVVVTKNTAFLSSTKPPRSASAVITLSDNVGNSESLTYNPTDETYYGSTIIGVVGRTYTLSVLVEGKQYTAVSVLPELYKADSIVPYFDPGNTFTDEGWYVRFYGADNPNKSDYYFIKGYANDIFLNEPTDIFVSDDRFLSQNVQGIDLDFLYEPGDNARVDFYSLTKEAYEFYLAAQLQLNSDGGFFSTPPANAPSNFNNGAFGLFQCSTRKPLFATIPN
jgi:hypothetical protein